MMICGSVSLSLVACMWTRRVVERLHEQVRDCELQLDRMGRTLARLDPDAKPKGEDHEPGTCEACDYDRATGELPVARVVRRPGRIL